MVHAREICGRIESEVCSVQFLTVFLTSLIAGTVVSQLQQVINDPRSIVTSLGAAAPQTATFFMLYLLLTGLIAKPFQFLRIPGRILHRTSLARMDLSQSLLSVLKRRQRALCCTFGTLLQTYPAWLSSCFKDAQGPGLRGLNVYWSAERQLSFLPTWPKHRCASLR